MFLDCIEAFLVAFVEKIILHGLNFFSMNLPSDMGDVDVGRSEVDKPEADMETSGGCYLSVRQINKRDSLKSVLVDHTDSFLLP